MLDTETADLISEEINRMKETGITAEPHDYGQYVQAAKCYLDQYKTALRRDGGQPKGWLHPNWPRTWQRELWQPDNGDAQHNLIMALALLTLERERLQELRRAVRPTATSTIP